MSTPHDNHSDSNYPEDGMTHYPKSKKKSGGLMGKIEGMARKVKGLQETKHFGAKRRARHESAKKAKLTGSKIPF